MLFFTVFIFNKNYADSLDSLKTILSKTKNDSVKIAVLTQISELCDESEIIAYANQNLQIIEKAFNDNKISLAYYNLEKARSLYNIGFYHFSFTSNYIETINYILNSIKLIEEKSGSNVEYQDLLSSDYNTIATAYMRIGKNELAEKYLLKSIVIDKKIGNDNYLSNDYNNLASAYYSLNEFDKAIFYFNLAITIDQKNKDTLLLPTRYCNIAELYLGKRDFGKVQTYLDLALNNLRSQSDSLNYFHYYKVKFKLFLLTNKINEAQKIIPVIQNLKHVNNYEYADYLKYLHDYYVKIGDYKSALSAYKQYKTVDEAAVNETIKVKSEVKQLTFDFEKKQLDEKNKNELELTKEHEKRQRQTFISIVIFLICIIIAVFSFIFYKKLKLTQKQNKIIEEQNSKIQIQHQLLEVKNKSITDSINYSKSIQSTLLAHYNQFNIYFNESFVIYEPKDVIGGDFYWTQKTDDNNLLIVVGDCTGHGVPGALISVLAMEALNKIYLTITDLSNLEELIKKLRDEFNKYYESDSLVSIGIDLSIIYIDKANNKVTLGGSGASIIGFKNNTITKYKFDSYNIGGKLPAVYTNQTQHIELENNQQFYLFTDGIVDMKGGELKKKYTMKNLENLIVSMQQISFNDQKSKVEQVIFDWNKDSEKIDDVTFLAIKL
jgi:serine phosphatase RsbU (regulator of sigma subunit)